MASQEHQVAVPESGNPDGDVQYFDSELDSDDDVQQTVDGAPNPPSQEGPSVRRRIAFEEMLIIWTFKRKNLAVEHHKSWIYEVSPSYGLKIGGRVEQERRPRMLHYRYSMATEFPEFLSKELQARRARDEKFVIRIIGPCKYGAIIINRTIATWQGMLVPSDTQINAMYDKFVCLGEVTPPVQGILPYASATTGEVEQPMNEKATRQEMLDPSDTQMNTMFDELVCLGELTAPAQGILAGVGGATGGLEHPVVRMYVDATPPAQSIIPYAVESSSHSPLQTMDGQAIPKVILNVMPIRRRFPARAIRSPFLHDDIQGGDTFDEYLKLEDGGMRNGGQPCGVDKTFFEENMQPNKQLHIEHIESYMSILSLRPDFAGLNGAHSKIGLMSSYFMETVEEVFDVMHRGMREEFQRYDHKLFDPTVEEVIPVEEMDRLCLFAEAVQPNWGENMKQWIDCDKVVTVCNYNDHWGTLLLDLKRQTIWLYDSMAWKFDYHHVCNRRDVFLPMTRIVPQILKRIGYYELHRVKNLNLHSGICVSHRLRKIFSSKMTVLIVVSTH
ncbi:hypothetical protein OROGR_005669 [Orobanche gracilis]